MNMIKKRTALGGAAEMGNEKCLKFLLDSGADVNISDHTVKPAVIHAVKSSAASRDVKCLEMLIKAGGDVNADYYNHTLNYKRPLLKLHKGMPRGLFPYSWNQELM